MTQGNEVELDQTNEVDASKNTTPDTATGAAVQSIINDIEVIVDLNSVPRFSANGGGESAFRKKDASALND